MLNQDIPDEFYDRVERVARQVQNKWPTLEWEDIRQETWLYLVERRTQLLVVVFDPEQEKMLRKIASECAQKMAQENEVAWGKYEYGTKHVRSMLGAGFLTDHRMGTLSEHHDLTNGMRSLKEEYPNHYVRIMDKYGPDVEPTTLSGAERMYLTRAVDKLTELMNRYRLMQIVDHIGLNSDEPSPPFDVIEDMFGGDEELYYSNMH
jgi:hypothetical protein